MRRKKSNLDEMQEQELLKVEYNGCWIAFWGLLAAIIIQSILLEAKTAKRWPEKELYSSCCRYTSQLPAYAGESGTGVSR